MDIVIARDILRDSIDDEMIATEEHDYNYALILGCGVAALWLWVLLLSYICWLYGQQVWQK